MRLLKLNLNYIFLILIYFFLIKLNIDHFVFKSHSIDYSLIDFFKKFNLFSIIEIITISLPFFFIKNKSFNFGYLFSSIFYLFLFIPFICLFFDPSSNLIKIFFSHIIFSTHYISIETKVFYFFIFIFTINISFLFFFLTTKTSPIKKSLNINKDLIEKTLLINFLIFFCLLSFFILKDFNQLHLVNYRSKLKGLLGYYFYWNIICLLPIFFLIQRNKLFHYMIILSYIFSFVLFKIKILLCFIIFLIFKDLIYNRIINSKDLLKTFLIINIITLIIIFLINFSLWYFFKIDDPTYFQRIFVSQPKNLLMYLDFFNLNNNTMMTHIGIIGKLTQNDNNIFDLIANFYRGGSPTSNVYAVEGIAAFGVWGIFFSTFLIILLSKMLSLFVCQNTEKYLYLTLIFQAVYMINTPFFTNLFTYGIGITLIFSLIGLKKKLHNA